MSYSFFTSPWFDVESTARKRSQIFSLLLSQKEIFVIRKQESQREIKMIIIQYVRKIRNTWEWDRKWEAILVWFKKNAIFLLKGFDVKTTSVKFRAPGSKKKTRARWRERVHDMNKTTLEMGMGILVKKIIFIYI